MPSFRDVSGQRFGRLVAMERAKDNPHRPGVVVWDCLCDCGKHCLVPLSSLTSGNTRSCGCLRSELLTRHGFAKHPLRRLWAGMIERCHKPSHKQFSDYGGRGIYVCDEWRGPDGLARFISDMGPRPAGLTVDRIDNSGPYSKGNCRWATYTTQMRNRRFNHLITHDGRTACISEWAETLGISHSTLSMRIRGGMRLEKALSPGLQWSSGEHRKREGGRFV